MRVMRVGVGVVVVLCLGAAPVVAQANAGGVFAGKPKVKAIDVREVTAGRLHAGRVIVDVVAAHAPLDDRAAKRSSLDSRHRGLVRVALEVPGHSPGRVVVRDARLLPVLAERRRHESTYRAVLSRPQSRKLLASLKRSTASAADRPPNENQPPSCEQLQPEAQSQPGAACPDPEPSAPADPPAGSAQVPADVTVTVTQSHDVDGDGDPEDRVSATATATDEVDGANVTPQSGQWTSADGAVSFTVVEQSGQVVVIHYRDECTDRFTRELTGSAMTLAGPVVGTGWAVRYWADPNGSDPYLSSIDGTRWIWPQVVGSGRYWGFIVSGLFTGDDQASVLPPNGVQVLFWVTPPEAPPPDIHQAPSFRVGLECSIGDGSPVKVAPVGSS